MRMGRTYWVVAELVLLPLLLLLEDAECFSVII